jgi:hypothetical protein
MDAVERFFNICFRHRRNIRAADLSSFSNASQLDEAQARELALAVTQLIKTALYRSPLANEQDYLDLFRNPAGDGEAGVQKKVMTVCAKQIRAKLPLWRQVAAAQRVSLPRALDIDWRVDLTTSSECISHTTVPTALFQMRVRGHPTKVGEMPPVEVVTFEANRGAVNTIVEGLRTVRDQLANIK